ncbi:uncharacterized protein L3040_001728 [Drepanopeziza brunnea f. sp. 'multigermtubi']|uniref:uncharacterized protein n=1 Tax=Drepanopeziza brunnea f. sp. 'multigermtubi' TaxID=698441 RepID=UPI002393AF57|nr:hypothetical protein L3040_001728 [Drepanopeziza brunnea f. sp. 'multigermtubi']
MPLLAVKGAVIVVAAAVAAAIAVYESPQARQFAEDVRRRIAVALHSLGDEINPAPQRGPRFNRPEDAEGFLKSQAGTDPGMDGDEESKRRQREELMHWNAVHLEKLEKERKVAGADRPGIRGRGSSFDDFLQQDESAEKGTYVYNTGADIHADAEEGLRQRGVRGLNRGSFYANPFGDENGIESEEQRTMDASLLSPEACEQSDAMSDLYSAQEEPRESRQSTATIAAEQTVKTSDSHTAPDPPVSHPSMEEPMLAETSNNYASMARNNDAYASIHAWADNANSSFYSPLPVTPRSVTPRLEVRPGSPTFSDPDVSVPGSGEATPTDSVSLAGSGEDVWATRSGATSEADVMSLDGDGIPTPSSWTEVGSDVSETDFLHH